MKRFLQAATFIYAISMFSGSFAEAQSSSSTNFSSDGLTMFGAIFYHKDGYLIEGLKSGGEKTPYLFVCGEPGKSLRVEGKDQQDLRDQFVAGHSDCLVKIPQSNKVQVVGPSGALFAEKNFASCRCTEAQIDNFFYTQACQNHDRFIGSDAIETACRNWLKNQQ